MTEKESPDLTLFYAPRSRSFNALWLLEELGKDYTLESCFHNTGRHKEADFLAINPMGKVPVVVHGGVPVSELGAIAIYLADRFPEAELGPGIEDPQRPEFLRWVFFASGIMEPALCEKFFDWDLPPRQVAWGSFDQMFQVLTDALSHRTWLLGDRFSAADVLVASILRFGQMFGALPKEGPTFEYVGRCTEREACQRAASIERREGERFPPPPRPA